MSYTFKAPTQLHWDCDLPTVVPDLLNAHGWQRVATVVDHAMMDSPIVQRTLQAVSSVTSQHLTYELTTAEPDIDFVDTVADELRPISPSVVIGVGGGSAMDVAKGVTALLANPGRAVDYQGFDLVPGPGVPSIMVPTTAGTGSEVTWTAVFTNRKTMRKLGINSRHILPRYALLDPALTLGLPPSVTLASGMDAITHAVESYTARNGNVIAQTFAARALQLLMTNLPRVLSTPDLREARCEMQLGATLAGWAILNAGTGACHSIAYALGTHLGVPHGLANAILLTHVMRINEAKSPGVYAELHDDVLPDGKGSPADRSLRLIELIEAVTSAGALRTQLSDFGAHLDSLEFLAERSLDLQSALENNPVAFGAPEARAVLRAVL